MTVSREAMLQRRSLGTSTPPLINRLAEITLPTLLIWGTQDKLVPLAHGVRINGTIFIRRLLAYSGLGHLPMEGAPAKTKAESVAFVNGLIAN